MFRRVLSFKEVWGEPSSVRGRALAAFVNFFERRTLAEAVYPEEYVVPYEFRDVFPVAKKLQRAGVVTDFFAHTALPDEPRMRAWLARVMDETGEKEYCVAGGSSLRDGKQALTATLAEAAERHVWRFSKDHFVAPLVLTVAEGKIKGDVYDIESFVGDRDGRFLSIRGYSWTSGRPQYVPVQLVSGVRLAEDESPGPWLREQITSGLATWATREGAVQRGLLELIERDAFMNMWLNQLSLPRYRLEDVRTLSSDLSALISECQRYRFTPHIIRLLTDAPTHALCVVLTDDTGKKPKVVLGLKAHASLVRAVEGALLEALRIRRAVRSDLKRGKEATDIHAEDIGHMDRLLYWADEARVGQLSFLIEGAFCEMKVEDWEGMNDEKHLARLIAWCTEKGFECTSVSLTRAKANVTPWHIETVVVPQLQWMHLHEKYQQINEMRRTEVPRMFGYTPRSEPFTTEPHPFA